MASFSLPPELAFHVIDHCVDEATSLQACSLVSKVWQRVAQQHLFSNIQIWSGIPDRSPSSFIAFLDSRPELCPHIRDVRIGVYPRRNPVVGEVNRKVVTHDLRISLSRIPKLRSLSIHSVHLTPGSPAADVLRNTIRIQSLHMQGMYFGLIDKDDRSVIMYQRTLLDFLGLFSSINTLCFYITMLSLETEILDDHWQVLQPSFLPRVRALRISNSACEVVPHVMGCVSPTDISSLEIDGFGDLTSQWAEYYQRCISSCTRLKELTIYTPYSDPAFVSVSLNSCRLLESLSLRIHISSRYGVNVVVNGLWDQSVALLASLPSSSVLRHLHLTLISPKVDWTLTQLNWEPFVLVLQRFCELDTVDIIIASYLSHTVTEDPCHPDLVAFFTRDLDEFFPANRQYTVSITH